MHTTLKISDDFTRAIMLRSTHSRQGNTLPRKQTLAGLALKLSGVSKPRRPSLYGTKSYRDALQRAFNRAKEQIYFNPDMQYFVTLTYAGIEKDIYKAMQDVKNLVRKERRNGNSDLKFIYIFEWQKRGSLHIHMITNASLTTHINKNGYRSLSFWTHGYTSMLTIDDFDNNFRPHLYLFKYMRKAERIGRSFVHASRNLDNYSSTSASLYLLEWRILNQETTHTNVNGTDFYFFRNYLCYDETINYLNHKEFSQWVLLQSQLQFKKVSAQSLVNHTQLLKS